MTREALALDGTDNTMRELIERLESLTESSSNNDFISYFLNQREYKKDAQKIVPALEVVNKAIGGKQALTFKNVTDAHEALKEARDASQQIAIDSEEDDNIQMNQKMVKLFYAINRLLRPLKKPVDILEFLAETQEGIDALADKFDIEL